MTQTLSLFPLTDVSGTGAETASPVLGGYAAKRCPTRTFHDIVTDPALAAPDSPGALVRMADGVTFEAAVFTELAALHTFAEPTVAGQDLTGVRAVKIPDCDRSVESKKLREQLTMDAMRAGVELIWNARLPHVAGRTGEPDLLVRGYRDSDIPGYHPVDVKHHKSLEGTAKEKPWLVAPFTSPAFDSAVPQVLTAGVPRSDDNYQLAHYWRMLEDLGFAADEPHGGVIGKERVVVWRALDRAYGRSGTVLEGYDAKWVTVFDVAQAATATPEDGPLVAPVFKAECKECPWRVVCKDELVDADHISLLPGITPTRVGVHAERGVTTRAQLARLSTDHPRYAGTATHTLQAEVDTARVTKAGTPHRARGVGFVDVPRATFEIDVDIEDSNGRMYLIGVADTWRHRRDGSLKSRTDLHSFIDWTDTDEGEARVFAEFWEYLTQAQAKATANRWGFRVYHYSDHETRYFRHLADKHAGAPGVPTRVELDAFLESPAWVDLYKVVKSQVVWPTEDHGLKSIAKVCGFSWRDDAPGGGNSLAWYADALGDSPEAEANRERLLAYNEDDVLATLAIRDWLSRKGEARKPGIALPAVEDLETRFTRRHTR